jgi:hypothetical protein
MKREIQRIEPVSAIRVGFLVGMVSGVIFGLIEVLLIKGISQGGGSSFLPVEAAELTNLSGGAMIVLSIVTGLIFSLIFAFLGAMMALLYNLAAHLFGGIEVFMSGDESAQTDTENDVSAWHEDENDV